MKFIRIAIALALTSLVFVGVVSADPTPQACPVSPGPTAAADCYYPEPVVRLNGQQNLTIQVGQTATGTWSYTGANPTYGCSLVGGWSGSAGGTSGSGSRQVGPHSSPITVNYAVNCPGSAPGYGYGSAMLTVVAAPPPPPPPPPSPPPGPPPPPAPPPPTPPPNCTVNPDACDPYKGPQCAVKPSQVFGNEAWQILGIFQNTCKSTALIMTNHACLVRREFAGATSFPTSFCVNDRCFGCTYLATTVTHVCGLAAWPYLWYVEGFGTAELLRGGYAVSQTVRGPQWAIPCR